MSRRRRSPRGSISLGGITFGEREVRDISVAWLVLSVAFAIFFAGGGFAMVDRIGAAPVDAAGLVVVSLATAGLGFVLHELAHKVVAVRYGQVAEFRADYQMLGIAILSALAGFIFAAPGAVHHAGRITARERGLIALAGPMTNVALGVLFVVPLLAGDGVPLLGEIGLYGVVINLFLAGFNMLPFGPLDGRAVLGWNPVAYAVAAVPTLLPGLAVVYLLFF